MTLVLHQYPIIPTVLIYLGVPKMKGLFPKQYFKNDAGFKSKIKPSFSNDYVVSLNSGITIWKWFEGYLDYGIFKNKGEKLMTRI